MNAIVGKRAQECSRCGARIDGFCRDCYTFEMSFEIPLDAFTDEARKRLCLDDEQNEKDGTP